MKAATDVVTEFGRVRDLDELTQVLGSAAEVMDASGLMVWIGSAGGQRSAAGAGARLQRGDDRAHSAGPADPPTTPPRPHIDRARCRSSCRVPAAPPAPSSRPILAADGCIGALSAEIRSGGETSESVQALAAIFAAQLANVLNTAPAAAEIAPPAISEPRAAANS